MTEATLLWVFFPMAITLHNLEEAIWLPEWSLHAERFHKPIESNEFYFAVIVVTILAYLATFLAIVCFSIWPFKQLFFGFLGAMILNTFIPHLAATIVLRRYSPGLLTGLFLLVPINSTLVAQAIGVGMLQWLEFVVATVVVAILLVSLLPLLFRLGKKLIDD